jgi:predicted nuclease with TOPRIM domain
MTWPKSFNPVVVIEELKRKLASIQEQGRGTRRENEQLRKENEQLRQQYEQLEQQRERLRQENERLKRQLGKRRAPASGRRHRSLAVDGNRTQNLPGANPALLMASVTAKPFPSSSTK